MAEIDKEELKKFEKHMGIAQEVQIGDDVFRLRPLYAEDIPDLLKIIQEFTNLKEGEEGRWLELMKKETSEIFIKLMKKMVSISYPDLSDNQVADFTSANFIPLSIALFQINDLGAKKVGTIKDKIDKLKAQRATPKE